MCATVTPTSNPKAIFTTERSSTIGFSTGSPMLLPNASQDRKGICSVAAAISAPTTSAATSQNAPRTVFFMPSSSVSPREAAGLGGKPCAGRAGARLCRAFKRRNAVWFPARAVYLPVEPNPPSPREVFPSSAHSSISGVCTGSRTSCAMRSPGSTVKGSSVWL